MSDSKSPTDDTNDPWKIAISAFVSVTHVIAFFQIVICSRHLAVAFNIPAKNIGIYFAKLYSLRSLLMSMGCAVEYTIYRIIQFTCSSGSNDTAKEVRRYSSIAWFVLLTICEVSFLLVLYFSKRVAYHNYIVLNLEGMFFGFFQMSVLSLIPDFAPYYMLSLYVSGTCIFIIQTFIDKCTKNSMLSVKVQSWICVFCSVLCVPSWIYYLVSLYKPSTQQTSGSSNGGGSNTSGPCSSGSTTTTRSAGFGVHPSALLDEPNRSMEYLMTMSPLTILKILTSQLTYLCQSLNSDAIQKIIILITRLQQITSEREITEEVLLAIELVILSIKSSCPPDQSLLLAQLSLFLRIKTIVKIEEQGKLDGEKPSESMEHRSRRVRRDSGQQTTQSKPFEKQLMESLSQLMFPIGSLVKDFLFPGVIPYGLLERDKCHLINLIVIIFLSVGPVVIFVLNRTISQFKCDNTWIHLCWTFMIPKIIILIISLCAIHTKQSSTHKIRSSQGTVLFMTVVLLTCYGFLETMSFVGMAHYVNFIGGKEYPDLQAIHNVFGKFFRYFVYKISVGYNKTRISAGFVLPGFKPPEPIPNTFCYWFKGSFSNGWKDIKGDFKMGIQQYLADAQTVSKKSPLESLRYCDLLM